MASQIWGRVGLAPLRPAAVRSQHCTGCAPVLDKAPGTSRCSVAGMQSPVVSSQDLGLGSSLSNTTRPQSQALAEPAQFLPASAELPGETALHEIQPCPPSASLPLTLSPPQADDDVPCSTSNSPLNLSCLLTQAESQCFLHLPFASMAANLVHPEKNKTRCNGV